MFPNRNILISVLIILFIGIGAYFLFFWKKPVWDISYKVNPEQKSQTYSGMIAENLKRAEADAKIYNDSMRKQDIKLCETIQDTNTKTKCQDALGTLIAKTSGNVEDCDRLSQTGARSDCRDEIYKDTATKHSNSLLCIKIAHPDVEQDCIETIESALLRQYILSGSITRTVCGDFTSEIYQRRCLAEIRDIDESATYKKALEMSDLNLCATITNADMRTLCADTINLKNAITRKDKSLCLQVKDANKNSACLLQIGRTQDTALRQDAINTSNLALCRQITDVAYRNNCNDTIIYRLVKSGSGTTALCDGLSNTGTISACKNMIR